MNSVCNCQPTFFPFVSQTENREVILGVEPCGALGALAWEGKIWLIILLPRAGFGDRSSSVEANAVSFY